MIIFISQRVMVLLSGKMSPNGVVTIQFPAAADALFKRVSGRALIFALIIGMILAGWPVLARSQEKSTVYMWLPTECAPENYPVRLLKGTLALADGSVIAMPDRRDVSNGWGRRGSTHIVGDGTKKLPVRLDLEWFSYTEDKFFKGSFVLPYQKMVSYFKVGIPVGQQSGQRSEFERIIVGMAPGGLVVIWLAAGAEVIEVGSWHAEVTDFPWTRVLNNPDVTRAAFVNQVLISRLGIEGMARLSREGVSTARFSDYRALYRWRPWVTGVGRAQQIRIRSFNGEQSFVGSEGPAIPRDQRPVPSEVDILWIAHGGRSMRAHIQFDEAEIFAAFVKISRSDANRQLALQLDTDADALAVSLRDENIVLPLRKARIEIFR